MIFIIISLLIMLFILSSCILSSKISKGENENEWFNKEIKIL